MKVLNQTKAFNNISPALKVPEILGKCLASFQPQIGGKFVEPATIKRKVFYFQGGRCGTGHLFVRSLILIYDHTSCHTA